MSERSQQQQLVETTERTGTDIWTIASAASVALALVTYFGSEDRELGIFIGLWAPTILAFASYVKQQQMYNRMDQILESGGVIERVEKIVQGR